MNAICTHELCSALFCSTPSTGLQVTKLSKKLKTTEAQAAAAAAVEAANSSSSSDVTAAAEVERLRAALRESRENANAGVASAEKKWKKSQKTLQNLKGSQSINAFLQTTFTCITCLCLCAQSKVIAD